MKNLEKFGAPAMVISPIGVDFLRGVAALAVLFAHADHGGLIRSDWVSAHKGFLGTFGVNLFFLLSGFLIWVSAKRAIDSPRNLATYLVHRFTRIVPLYYVNIAFVVFLLPHIASSFQPVIESSSVVRHLLFTQSLNPSITRDLNPVLWTLTHEMFYYLSVPLLMLAARWMGMTVMLVVATLLIGWGTSSGAALAPFIGVLWLFLVGAAFAHRGIPQVDGVVVLGLIGLFGFGLVRGMESSFGATLLALIFFTSLMTPSLVNVVNRYPLPFKPVAFVGLVSYSLYIWHYLLINIFAENQPLLDRLTLGLWFHSDFVRASMVVLSFVAISAVSYYLIEYPSMGVVRRKLLALVRRDSGPERAGDAGAP